MFCPQCGTQLEEGKEFCKNCGARLSDHARPAGPPPTAPRPPGSAPPLPGSRGDAPPVTFPTLPSAATVQQAAIKIPPPQSPPPQSPPPQSPPPFQAPPQNPPPNNPPPYQAPPPFVAPPQGPPPFQAPPPFVAPPAQSPPPYQVPPSAGPPGMPYAPGAAAAARNERPGWVIPFLVVMGIVIAVSIIGLAVILFSGDGDSPKATGTVVTATTLAATSTGSGPPTETTLAGEGSGTTATIPGYDPNSTTAPTSGGTSGGNEIAYLSALDGLESALSYADSRIPELAQQINATAPGVPASVSRELQEISDDVQTAQDLLASNDPPARFQRADDLIFQASGEMLYRIDQTYQGIDAMWAAGKVSAGNPYFDEGRKARDAFRRLFDQYRAARPYN